MTQQQNRIYELVRDHLSLDTKSLEIFRHRLIEPLIPDCFKDKIDSEFRIRINLGIEERQSFDSGWRRFCDFFYYSKKKFNITYSDFVANRIIYNKNTYKIATLLKKEGEDNYALENLKDCLEQRLSNDAGQLVISFNFADWFLCSTSENWTSCMNLESEHEGSYWASIPGFVVDQNRCLVYIVNGKKKEYLGITTDSFLARTWGLLDKNDILNLIRFYPVHINDEGICKHIENTTGIKTKHLEEGFKSKYSFDLLRFETGDSCYGYIDCARLVKKDGKFRISYGDGGFNYYNKDNKYINSDLFCYEYGFKELVKRNDKIGNYLPENDVYYCDECGDSTEDVVETDDGMYCQQCYNEIYDRCSDCDSEIFSEDSISTAYDTTICSNCYEQDYFTCDKCGEVYNNEDMKKIKSDSDGMYCNKCKNRILQKSKSVV